MTTIQYTGSENNDPKTVSRPEHRLISVEFVDPECPLCDHIIQQVNEIFEHNETPCSEPKEYCITHLLESVHTYLVWMLSKQ
jgi:hypothetical protein